jgi:hypothetical protein
MNKDDLHKTLIEENFNPSAYSLDDDFKDEALSLRWEEGRWSVYYSERGLKTGKIDFDDEDSACEYFINEMRSDPTTKISWKSGFSM